MKITTQFFLWLKSKEFHLISKLLLETWTRTSSNTSRVKSSIKCSSLSSLFSTLRSICLLHTVTYYLIMTLIERSGKSTNNFKLKVCKLNLCNDKYLSVFSSQISSRIKFLAFSAQSQTKKMNIKQEFSFRMGKFIICQ